MNDKVSNITIEKLTHTFDMKTYEVHALKDISFTVKPGEFVGLIGPSGSGKTTLINCLSGLLTATSGKIMINGVDLTKLSMKEKREFRLHSIGMVFQEHLLVDSLTALENVELPLLFGRVPEEERKRRAKELLIKFGLEDKIDHLPSELSGGEQQRVGIARALVYDPLVILADEPTGDLDTKTGLTVIQTFKDIAHNDGKSVIMVSHDPRHRAHFDRVLELLDGMLVSRSS
ncbi:MAG: ABC transporter ATP-binding protein [Candidatus Heimdallarchaeaceae archaeon]